ncbi:MAG: ketoacyl-ACP synthase III [Candidatus Omnitrophica bacterium]|nr:ketoacyl-ACP synthase III [Candidatus Omnitrophota bacterium]
MTYAKIVGLGKYLPPDIVTNADLEKKVDTTDEWIRTRTGINERRILKEREGSSSLAYKASLIALKKAGIKPQNLDLIIVATITPDTLFPSTACYLQNYLKATNAGCLDISAACAGFVYGLTTAWQYIHGGLYKNILVVGSEVLTTITDWQDRSTCILFGDGAGAAVLTQSSKQGFMSADLGADGSESDVLSLPAGGSRMPASIETVNQRLHTIKMKGTDLFRIAVRAMTQTAENSLKKVGLTGADVDMLIPHQANKRIIDAVVKRLGLSFDNVYINVERYGNMSSASSAVALCEAVEENKIKSGDIVVVDAFGGGLVWGSCVIKWV